MKTQGALLVAAILMVATILPAKAPAQSQAPGDETRELRKLIEQMRLPMPS
jgi:hypothetical protein